MARKPKQTELSTGIALGERLATLEAGFAELKAFVQVRVRWLVLIALSALMQVAGTPLASKFGAFLQACGAFLLELGLPALRAVS